MKTLHIFSLLLLSIMLCACTANDPDAEEAASLHTQAPSPEAAHIAEPTGSPASDLPPAAPPASAAVDAASAPAAPTVASTPAEALPAQAAPTLPQPNASLPPSHEAWDALLQQYVNAIGKVNYRGLLAEGPRLQAYLDALAAQAPDQSWPRDEKLAYWINAYNAFTVKLILDHYPLASILDLHGGKTWDVRWIELGGQTYSLNQIEHEIIRPQFREPRIHFAVNCAAVSCPPLLNRAWTAARLEADLERQTEKFINNPAYNQLSAAAVRVSKIFEWYAEDFGGLIAYLNRYGAEPIDAGAQVSFLEYDWRLNGQ
jgi:hypothetical protein